jgi:UrcA family protein
MRSRTQTKEHIMKSIQLLFSVAALSLAGIAGAGTPEVRSVVVKYGDLNLATQAGVARLHTRLRNAAESVCSPLDSRILSLRDGYGTCVSDAIARSIAAVGNENLSKYHHGEKSAVLASN